MSFWLLYESSSAAMVVYRLAKLAHDSVLATSKLFSRYRGAWDPELSPVEPCLGKALGVFGKNLTFFKRTSHSKNLFGVSSEKEWERGEKLL